MPKVIVGVGFRAGADADAIRRAMLDALGPLAADAVAAADDKADAPALVAAVAGLPIVAVAPAALADADARCPTQSERVRAQRGVGSLCEAAALAAAGPGGKIVAPRVVSPCGMATAAVAVAESAP